MRTIRTIALALLLAVVLSSTAMAQEKKKRSWVGGTIKSLDLANNTMTVTYKGKDVTAPLGAKLKYEKWAAATIDDFEEGRRVGVWGKFQEGQETLAANNLVVQYSSKNPKPEYANYKFTGAFKRVDGKPALVLGDTTAMIELGPRATILDVSRGKKDEMAVGMKVNYPSFGSGDSYPPVGYLRYFPPKK